MKRKLATPARPGRGRPPAHEVEQREERLLDAATETFLATGFRRASMNDIAQRAGASKQTLYARYPSKSALFAAVMERKSSQIFRAIGPLGPDAPMRDTLLHFGCALLNVISSPEATGLHRVILAECLDNPELGAMFWDIGPGRVREHLTAYFDSLRQSGQLDCADAALTAEMLLGLLISPMHLRMALGLAIPQLATASRREAWVARAVDVFLRSASEAPPR